MASRDHDRGADARCNYMGVGVLQRGSSVVDDDPIILRQVVDQGEKLHRTEEFLRIGRDHACRDDRPGMMSDRIGGLAGSVEAAFRERMQVLQSEHISNLAPSSKDLLGRKRLRQFQYQLRRMCALCYSAVFQHKLKQTSFQNRFE
jgi:hypothetical protein